MTIKKIVGAILVSIPFLLIYASAVSARGWGEATMIFMSAFAIVALVILGAFLLAGVL